MKGELTDIEDELHLSPRSVLDKTLDMLIKQSPLRGRVPAARLIENPGHYTILENLPYREHIEGIRYLFQYNITTGRETEIFALFCSFQNYLEYLMEITLDIGVADGFMNVFILCP